MLNVRSARPRPQSVLAAGLRFCFAFAASFALGLVPVAHAAAPPASKPAVPRPVLLTLDDAVARAERVGLPVRRAQGEAAAVAARQVGAAQWLPANPVASFAAGPRHERGDGTLASGTQMSGHLEQTLEVAGQRGTRRAEVAHQTDAASWRTATARAETRAQARAAYVGAQLADAGVKAARQRDELVQQLVDSVRARVESGAASEVDLDLARIERGRAVRDRVDAELALAAAFAQLRLLIALPAGAPIQLGTPLGPPPSGPDDVATLLAIAAERRPELRFLQSARRASDAAIVRLRREAVPNPTVFADVERDLPGQTFVGAGVAVPLPIWRRNQGELALARAERDRLTEEQTLAAREIAAEVERAQRGVSLHGELVKSIAGEMLPAAESAADLVTQGWRAGKFDLFRVIQASREAAEARRSYLQALGALWTAAISLDRAVGLP